jgi:progressive ankylosis protein
MTDIHKNLSFKKVLLFWIPLAATWLMMSVEGPYLSAVIARMADPKYNLAAYGVAFSFAIIVEAPVIMMMSASTALVKGYGSFCRLKKFTYTTNLITTLVMIIFNLSPVFYFITETLIGLPREVSSLTHTATTILIPWPASIGYRRFYQGVMIKHNQTRRVAYGTVVRLVCMSGTAFVLFVYSNFEGAVIGAFALSAGVISEALASKLMVFDILKKIKAEDPAKDEILSYKEIINFYLPLALTSFIGLAVQPMITFFVGRSRMPLESLAVLPVISSLVFIFRSVGLSFQEVGIALIGDKFENYRILKNFALVAGVGVVALLAFVSFTPLADIWFHNVSGLSTELTDFSLIPLMIMTLLPGLTFLISVQRAILVAARNTKPISRATSIEVTGIIIVMFIAISFFDAVGAVAAASALLLGRIAANIYLVKPYNSAVKLKNILSAAD